jgi:hypothetical protein
MSSNISKYGKVRYIEPNAILQDKLYGKKIDGKLVTGPYNIPHNMEEYAISVDLIVVIPDRNGSAGNKTNVISLGDIGDKKSIFSGTNGFMTDKPGMTTYYDIIDKDYNGNSENLGITNIHITYNSYFYPEVTIKFTDVRGAALMMPHEENYRRKMINAYEVAHGNKAPYDSEVESFFSCLFSFPYPEFKLRVKGFYGKQIEYSLLVSDFRSSFNPNTGNFDATVKFIGKMFGVYSDIPMSYLIMAPYCKYGGTNNYTLWQKKNFTLNGIPMPTFVDLRQKLIQANHELKSDMTHKSIGKYSEATKRLSELNAIKTLYDEYYSLLKERGKDRVISGKKYDEDVMLFEINSNNTLSYLYPTNNTELDTVWKNLSELISKYNSNSYMGMKLPFPDEQEPGKRIGINNMLNRKIIIKGGNTVNVVEFYGSGLPDGANQYLPSKTREDIFNSNNGLPVETVFNPTFKYLTGNILNVFKHGKKGDSYNNERSYYLYYAKTFADSLTKQIKDTEDEIKKLKKEVEEEYTSLLEELLGFVPNIRNLFKITMAHLQVFMEIYSTCLKNIKGEEGRTLFDYGLTFEDTDIRRNGKEKETFLPPFPAILKRDAMSENGNSYEYPSYAHLNKVMEEEILVDSFFDGSFLMLNEEVENKELIASITDSTLEFLPTNLTDIVTQVNPYNKIFDENSSIEVDRLMMALGTRMIQHFNYEQRVGIKDEDWGRMEAYNFWRQNPKITSSLLKKLQNDNFSSSSFINFLKGEKCAYIENKPCYQFDKNTTRLVTTNKKNNIVTTGNFNFPATYTSYNLYRQDLQDAHKGFRSFPSGMTYIRKEKNKKEYRPIDFIKIYDDYDFIVNWKNQIKNANISEECGDDSKSILIENSLLPLKSIFTDKDNTVNNVYYRDKSTIGSEFECSHYNKDKDLNKKYKDFKTVYSEGFKTGFFLDNIQDIEGNSYFISNAKTEDYFAEAERFLLCFPYNFDGILKIIADGKKMCKLPYIYQLFFGCCIKYIQESNENIAEYKLLNLWKKHGYASKVNWNDLSAINKVLRYFLLQKNNEYEPENYKSDDLRINDYLGLREKYEKWVNNNDFNGFRKVYDTFKLKPKTNINFPVATMISYIVKNKKEINGKKTYYEIFKSSSTLNKICSNIFSNRYTTGKPKNVESLLNELFEDFTYKYASVSVYKNSITLHFNDSAPGYTNLCELISKDSLFISPYQLKTYESNEAPVAKFNSAFNAFKNTLLSYYINEDETTKTKIDFTKLKSDDVSKENKLSMYLTLKNLYDKHLFNLDDSEEIEKYDINSKDSEFDRFHFIDSCYSDIGDKLIMNGDIISNLIGNLLGYEENGDGSGIMSTEMSLYSFMSLLCQKNNMMLLAMPVFNGAFVGPEGDDNLSKMFTPVSYNDSVNEKPMKGPSYVCLYPYQPSYHLDIPNSQYSNDGFDISPDPYVSGNDIADTGGFLGPTPIGELFDNNNEYIIPAFGVEYGIQNQGIFKSVNVNMDNPQTTEQSVAAMFQIANMQNQETVRQQSYMGQDLYKVYSNHSYTCTVEMMGCAQIQPLMYFQLTNIPMFKGAYMIIKVEHDIVAGNMTTTFTGVRINKNKIPMVTTAINLNDILELVSTVTPGSNKVSKEKSIRFNGALFGQLDNVNRFLDVPDMNYKYEDILKLNVNKKIVQFQNIESNNNGAEGAFNESNKELRKLVYGIARRAGETFGGITITSIARTKDKWLNKSSDHCIGNNTTQKRKELYGPDYLDKTKAYSEMGCAVDMLATNKNGTLDKQESSIALFDLIALEFTDNIRQLIWEVKENACPSNNFVSNCIHLSSYGHGEDFNGKPEIYVGQGSSWHSIKADNINNPNNAPTNLPPMFIKILYRMTMAGKDLNKVKLNNFTGIPVTKELLRKWCEQLGV